MWDYRLMKAYARLLVCLFVLGLGLVGGIARAEGHGALDQQFFPESMSAEVHPAWVNPRYGVFISRVMPPEQVAWTQAALGTAWWLEPHGTAPRPVAGKVPILPLHAGSRLSGEQLMDVVWQFPPGTTWYAGGEANVPTQGNMPGDEYAVYFHEAAAAIRAADPDARVMAASVLNAVDTCRGCQGYTLGLDWIESFRSTYLELFGEEPPVDVWAIDSYLLDWEALPMIDVAFMPRQVRALRTYLDGIPEQAGKPIWLTEFGVIWAYESMEWFQHNGAWDFRPAGAFRDDLLEAWLVETLTWLETDGVALGVERWFLFASSRPPGEPWYHGIELLQPDESGTGWTLTPLGHLYAAFATGGVHATAPMLSDEEMATSPEAE
jgi:hypothetical protein